jgi:plastocyanin
MRKALLSTVVAGTAAALLVAAAALAAPPKVVGKVGPGHTIGVTIGGKRVKTLKAGTKYRFVVTDRSEDHDFRLIGPGVSKVITSEGFVGTKSALVTLRKGTYRFFCAPHAEDMHGTFRAVA